jgi:hypothetical protein
MKKLLLSSFVMLFLGVSNLFAQPISFHAITPYVHYNIPLGDPDTQQVKSFAYITNNTGINLDSVYIVLSNPVYPAGWIPPGICTWLTCYPDSLYNLPKQICAPGNDTIDVYFSPMGIPGTASCRITVTYRTTTVYQDFTIGVDPIGIHQISTVVHEFSMGQNYPNPFNPSTKINFTLPKSEYTYLRIYDILGREVKTLVNGPLNAGEYQVDFDAKDLASGMYYYSLRAGENVTVKKMVLVK